MTAPPYRLRPLTEADARAVLGWRYPPPYDVYNPPPDLLEDGLRWLLEPAYRYHAVLEGAVLEGAVLEGAVLEGSGGDGAGRLIAFCCYGEDARVSGGDYREEALDVGLGLRPDRLGQGLGGGVLAAVLAFAERAWAPAAFRATVAGFNHASITLFERAGFGPAGDFAGPAGVGYRQFVRRD